MMFPDHSRRARRAIGAYLNRMDAGIVEDDQGKKKQSILSKKPNQSLIITQDQIVTLQRRQGSRRRCVLARQNTRITCIGLEIF